MIEADMNIKNWEKIKTGYENYWSKENHDRILLAVTAPSVPRGNYISYDDLTDKWENTEKIIHNALVWTGSTYYAGEAFPTVNPDLGPDFLTACFGIDLTYGENTSWASHKYRDSDFESIYPLRFDPESHYFKKITEITNSLLAAAEGRFLVGQPDLHPGADALCALRSSEQLCYDTVECPDEVRKASLVYWKEAQKAYEILFSLTRGKQDGYTHWMSLWNKEPWYTTSCDFICMIGPEAFDNMIWDELCAEFDYLEHTIFHLDGPQAVRHLPKLLSHPRINGIQWVPGAGSPGFAKWIPMLQTIQKAGKTIHLSGSPEEIPLLCENLSPEGVYYQTSVSSPDEADSLIKLAESYYRKKIF